MKKIKKKLPRTIIKFKSKIVDISKKKYKRKKIKMEDFKNEL